LLVFIVAVLLCDVCQCVVSVLNKRITYLLTTTVLSLNCQNARK